MTILPEIEKRLPLFLRNDKNGYALAKALEAGMAIFTETLHSGLDIAQNPDEMPEWRLDMLAWELNCYYDYGAPVERKREWIREAESLFAAYGTRAGVIRALLPFFETVEVEETGDFRFSITAAGNWNEETAAQAILAAEAAKNVRSKLDGIQPGSFAEIRIQADTGVFPFYPPSAGSLNAGIWPTDTVV